MNRKQLARLEHLNAWEFLTFDEHAELCRLLRLQSDMRHAFERLSEQGLRPTWVGGEYIVANPPDGTARTVRSLPDALRLVHA